MSEFCTLARQALTEYLSDGNRIEPHHKAGFQAGCFVTLHDAHGELRGCIGTIEPRYFDLGDEIVSNAISAGTKDPRFPAVTAPELAELTIEVSVLQPPQPVQSLEELDPRRYGVVVRNGARRGVLLPDIEGVDTVAYQLAITRRKARIGPDEPIEIEKFVVDKYIEGEDVEVSTREGP